MFIEGHDRPKIVGDDSGAGAGVETRPLKLTQ